MFFQGIAYLLVSLINSYIWVIIVECLMSAAAYLGFLKPTNTVLTKIHSLLQAITVPAYKFVTKKLPFVIVGAVDLSPIALVVVLNVIILALWSVI